MKNSFIIIVFLVFCKNLVSCKDEYTICNPVKEVKFIAGFYQKVAGADVATQPPSLNVLMLNNTTPLYNNQNNLIEFGVTLNPLTDTARYSIGLATNLPKDTITIVYLSQNSRGEIGDCGNVNIHSITKIYTTTNTIDSITTIQPLVNTRPQQNAKIYF
jgi:hypothetical protein